MVLRVIVWLIFLNWIVTGFIIFMKAYKALRNNTSREVRRTVTRTYLRRVAALVIFTVVATFFIFFINYLITR
jgi:hypothetical protein